MEKNIDLILGFIILMFAATLFVSYQATCINEQLDTILEQTAPHAKQIEFVNGTDTVFDYKNIGK